MYYPLSKSAKGQKAKKSKRLSKVKANITMLQSSPVRVTAPSAQDVLLFQASRQITFLFKSQLALVEELKEQHDIAILKLIESLPIEYREFVRLADYFDDTQAQILRRKILGNGNDIKREFETILNNFDVEFKGKNS